MAHTKLTPPPRTPHTPGASESTANCINPAEGMLLLRTLRGGTVLQQPPQAGLHREAPAGRRRRVDHHGAEPMSPGVRRPGGNGGRERELRTAGSGGVPPRERAEGHVAELHANDGGGGRDAARSSKIGNQRSFDCPGERAGMSREGRKR